MKKTNFTLSNLKYGLSFCLMMVVMFFASQLQAQVSTQLPPLKPVQQAIDALYAQKNSTETLYKTGGSADVQLKKQIDLFSTVIDALNNRQDQNMNTESVVLSSLVNNNTAHLIVRNGNTVDLDATVRSILSLSEYQALINTVKI
ncbi:MAG TPA: hypothetical protein PK006_10935 [Saprospiraceae bacterium]|nr:hypothetical protein [Saprospiraceae bacterium]